MLVGHTFIPFIVIAICYVIILRKITVVLTHRRQVGIHRCKMTEVSAMSPYVIQQEVRRCESIRYSNRYGGESYTN